MSHPLQTAEKNCTKAFNAHCALNTLVSLVVEHETHKFAFSAVCSPTWLGFIKNDSTALNAPLIVRFRQRLDGSLAGTIMRERKSGKGQKPG